MKTPPPARRSLVVLALLLAAILVATAASQAARTGSPESAFAPGEAPKVDGDGNGLFDDLEARLAETSDEGTVNVLVALKSSATLARVAELSERLGFATGKRFGIVDAFAATVTKAQARALANLSSVAHVELDGTVYALNDSAQSSFGVTKARLDAPALDGDGDGNANAYSPADLVAAVIDTGIDANHLDLNGGKVLAFRDYVNGQTTPYDDNGHGTHVAGTIAGDGEGRADRAYKGVAPAAGLVGIKVLNSAGSGSFSNVIAALDWIVANKSLYGIEAANLSLGADGCNSGTDLTSQAIARAVAAGIVVAVAAGNAGPGTCTVGTPGAAPAALTVGAMSDLGPSGFALASFSSRGLTADGRVKPDVVAAGVSVTSAAANTTNGYSIYSGTSMATPFVAGVSLLLRDANPSLTPQQVKDAIMSTAVDWGPAGPDRDYGAGRLDAYAALRAAGAPLGPTGPAVPAHTFSSGTLAGTGTSTDIPIAVTDAQFPIAATLIMSSVTGATSASPNFNLSLLNPSGTPVASATSSSRQDALSYRPSQTGTYTLRVVSASGSGPYFVDISAGTNAGTPPPPPQPTAPGPPSLTSATPSEGVVALGWTAPASNGGSAITGYKIYRGTSSGGQALHATWGTGTTWNDTAVTGGVTYYYKVAAVNAIGDSPLSNELSATPPAPATVPGAPTLVSATPGNGQVALAWSAPGSNGGSAITGYDVHRSTTSGSETFLVSLGTGTSWTDSGLANGTTYYYKLTARNAVGAGQLSNELSATPTVPADATPPSRPGGMNLLVAGTHQLAIDWTASTDNVGVTGYEVYRGGYLVATVTKTWFLDSGLVANTNYSYQVRALDAAGNRSTASTSLTARTANSTTSSRGILAGFVVDANGAAVRTATATFASASGQTKSDGTNSKGVWSISNLLVGPGTLTISAPGHATVTLTVTVVAGKTVLTATTFA